LPLLKFQPSYKVLNRPHERGLYPKQMSDSRACSKERCFDVSLERSKKEKYGENDIIMNYTKNLMKQTSLTILTIWRLTATIWVVPHS